MVELLSGKVIVPKAYIIPVELVVRESCGSRILANRSNTPEGRHRLLEQLT
jgi:phosphoribosylaminoimidazole-succinocarboxamide synthase